MNANPPTDIAALLKREGLRPRHRLGQNFLRDSAAMEQITASAEIQKDDAVLEIGCGLGGLTQYLASDANVVIAVELDSRLANVARRLLAPHANIRVVCGDILDLAPRDLGLPEGYIVAANIPYYVTSAILRHLLESRPIPRRLVLTVQKEVAERICAGPPDMSVLALSVQVYGAARVVATIPANAFYPPPKVDSAVVRIDVYPEPAIPTAELALFFEFAKAGFRQKRKTLSNSLASALRLSSAETRAFLEDAGIDPRRRAETMSIDEWERLVRGRRPDLPGRVVEASDR